MSGFDLLLCLLKDFKKLLLHMAYSLFLVGKGKGNVDLYSP